jgi:hypothetical protein
MVKESRKTAVATEAVEKVWDKIQPDHRSGSIPVYNGSEWRVFRNTQTIYAGAETAIDPAKADVLRQNVVDLLGHYPKTVQQLEKLGVRVRSLLNHRIESCDDVVAWGESFFNYGPPGIRPAHAQDTMDLAYDDIIIEVKRGRDPFYVVPATTRGTGVSETVDFSWPGAKRRYGSRHPFTERAFSIQEPKAPKPPRYRGKTAEGEPQRPRGRPRKDGLAAGSKEARAADRKKERERQAKRKTRQAKKEATITELPRRRLVRIRDERKEAW